MGEQGLDFTILPYKSAFRPSVVRSSSVCTSKMFVVSILTGGSGSGKNQACGDIYPVEMGGDQNGRIQKSSCKAIVPSSMLDVFQ
jgi:hypothetical protein